MSKSRAGAAAPKMGRLRGYTGIQANIGQTMSKDSRLKVPEGYKVYETLVGTWRWSKGVFGTPSWTDGENLENENAAIRDAIRDAALQT